MKDREIVVRKKKMPLNRKIDLVNALSEALLKKRIKEKLDILEKELNEKFNKQIDDLLESLLDDLSE